MTETVRMETRAADGTDEGAWFYSQPRSREDFAEREADLADPSPRGRCLRNDFRRRSITVPEWQALKTLHAKRTRQTQSKPRATRRASRTHSTSSTQVIGRAAADAKRPTPAESPFRHATGSSGLSVAPAALASTAATEVLPLGDRERRLIDFLVDEALNEWWTQNSRD